MIETYNYADMHLKIKFLEDAKDIYGDTFKPQTSGSIGFDLRSFHTYDSLSLEHHTIFTVHLGICIEPSPGMAGFIYPRSGFSSKTGRMLVNGVGVIDPDYRGELIAKFLRPKGVDIHIPIGERVAQLVFHPYVIPKTISIVDELSETERGSGGFGSTGTS